MLFRESWNKTFPVDEVGQVLIRAAEIIEVQGHLVGAIGVNGGPRCVIGAIGQAADELRQHHWAGIDRLDNYLQTYCSVYSDSHTKAEVISALLGAASAK